MNTLTKIYAKLRYKNIRNYGLRFICNLISVLLICAFGVVIQSRTVQAMLPEGGDPRKQMMKIFVLSIDGTKYGCDGKANDGGLFCHVLYAYADGAGHASFRCTSR